MAEFNNNAPLGVFHDVSTGSDKILTVWIPESIKSKDPSCVKSTVRLDHWSTVELHWCSSLETLSRELLLVEEKIQQLNSEDKDQAEQQQQLNDQINQLNKDLSEKKLKERAASHLRDEKISLVGRSHIKRDPMQSQIESEFPTGAELKDSFSSDFMNFEIFAIDAIETLEQMLPPDNVKQAAAEVFVRQIMAPIHALTYNFVHNELVQKRKKLTDAFGVAGVVTNIEQPLDNRVHNLFWYSSMQVSYPRRLLRWIDDGTNLHDFIAQNSSSLGPLAMQLDNAMRLRAEASEIDYNSEGGQDITLPCVVRLLLKYHALALLSDPPCYLHPTPGEKLRFAKDGRCKEILCPGRGFKSISEGEEVEIVLCGLHFDDPRVTSTPTAAAASTASIAVAAGVVVAPLIRNMNPSRA